MAPCSQNIQGHGWWWRRCGPDRSPPWGWKEQQQVKFEVQGSESWSISQWQFAQPKDRLDWLWTSTGSLCLPEEELPDLCHNLPWDDLHFHGLVRPHCWTVGAEDVVVRDGSSFYVAVCLVLPEILSHPHSPFILTGERRFTLSLKEHWELLKVKLNVAPYV